MSRPTADMPTAEQAMERLMAGNKRYVASKQTHPHQTRERCVELSAGQYPFAVILGCAAAHLHTPLIVVLGHSRCGAVGATVAGGELEGHLPSLAAAIQPYLA